MGRYFLGSFQTKPTIEELIPLMVDMDWYKRNKNDTDMMSGVKKQMQTLIDTGMLEERHGGMCNHYLEEIETLN